MSVPGSLQPFVREKNVSTRLFPPVMDEKIVNTRLSQAVVG